jgi:LysM repeat protein
MTAKHSKRIIVDWRRTCFNVIPSAIVVALIIFLNPFSGGTPDSVKDATSVSKISDAGCLGCATTQRGLITASPALIKTPVKIRTPVKTTAVKRKHILPARYTVRDGDTLSKIARRFYGHADDWGFLYYRNKLTITDANLIYTGQALILPEGMPKGYTLAEYLPKRPAVATTPAQPTATPRTATQVTTPPPASPSTGGTLSCSGLENLWDSAGGNPSGAFMAAEIAEAESGGQQYATDHDSDGTVDEGYWQINSSNGALSTYDAYGNAKAAITLSDDGRNWSAWVTDRTGAYSGLC